MFGFSNVLGFQVGDTGWLGIRSLSRGCLHLSCGSIYGPAWALIAVPVTFQWVPGLVFALITWYIYPVVYG